MPHLPQRNLNIAQISEHQAYFSGLSVFDLNQVIPEMIPHHLISENLLKQHLIVPIYQCEQQLLIGIADPIQVDLVSDIQFHTGLNVQVVIVARKQLSQLRETILNAKTNDVLINYCSEIQTQQHTDTVADDSPVVKFINHIINDAILHKASDIHFEPYEHCYRIRFRLDGLLYQQVNPPLALARQFSARIKIMANLDISERRYPQDGHIRFSQSQQTTIDLRVSTCPTLHGEKVVLRILDPCNLNLTIEQLGFESSQLQQLMKAIAQPHGMILITGPTGSGKSSTLYTLLQLLNQDTKNICTIEDPVELIVDGITQINVNSKNGFTFSTALKTFLRQDPDIIMVGEMRDSETAEIAFNAANTGHLVLSTLHTNNAISSISRLLQLKILHHQIADSVSIIIAQRLVRKLCNYCRQINNEGNYCALGCQQCHGGYKGRVGIFEIVTLTPQIAELIMKQSPEITISQAAHQGMLTLRQAARLKIIKGDTTLAEINRVLKDEE